MSIKTGGIDEEFSHLVCSLLLVSIVSSISAQDLSVTADTSKVDYPSGTANKAIMLIDSFEDGDVDGWLDGGGGCGFGPVFGNAGSGNYSMSVCGGCGHYGGRYYEIGGFQATGVSVMLRPSSVPSFNSYFVVGDSDIAINNGVIFFYAHSDGHWYIVGPDGTNYDCGAYTPYQWHDISFTLDWNWRTINVTINGGLRHVHVPFRSTTSTTLSQVHFYNIDVQCSNIDHIQMSSPPAIPGLFSDDFESGDATSWSDSQPDVPPLMYIYDGRAVAGAIGGRRGADIMCVQAAWTAGLPSGVMTRALISVAADDEIRDMPNNYGVPTDRKIMGASAKIADSWPDLLDGSIDTSLKAAGVTSDDFWYTGSNTSGGVTSTTCSGWTDGNALLDGRRGRTWEVNSNWISVEDATCGLTNTHVMCVAWR